MREIARYRPGRYDEVFSRWPIREALLAYRAICRREARRDYRTAMLRWAVLAAAGAKIDPPTEPDVLKE